MGRKKITILIPSYNEEGNIDALMERLEKLAAGKSELPAAVTDNTPHTGSDADICSDSHISSDADICSDDELRRHARNMADYDWEFLFVNDGSSDRTLAKLKERAAADSRVSVVNLSRNFGKEAAMLAGFDYAQGDAVVVMDADLQHPPEYIPEMVYWWSEKGYADVYGRRLERGRESKLRKNFSLAFYRLLSKGARFPILENVGDFRLMDRKMVDTVRSLRESQRLNKGLFCWAGFSKKDIPFVQEDRKEGVSSFNMGRLFSLAIDGLTSFSTAPLRMTAVAGFVVSLLALAYAVYIVCKTLIYGDPVAGFPTLICVVLFLGGLQLLALGIIGEYIGRIYLESKHRPPYVVESYIGGKERDRDVEL